MTARLDEILEILLADTLLSWDQQPDGSYVRPGPGPDEAHVDTHEELQRLARERTSPRRPEEDHDHREDRVEAAGGVVLRTTEARTEVLVVHRPRYDDWSLPKGKLDPGEEWEDAALREVHEETGVAVESIRELSPVSYTDRKDRPKTIRWWLMRAVEGHPSHRGVDREVDEARWVDVLEAQSLLSYDTDRALLTEAQGIPDTPLMDGAPVFPDDAPSSPAPAPPTSVDGTPLAVPDTGPAERL